MAMDSVWHAQGEFAFWGDSPATQRQYREVITSVGWESSSEPTTISALKAADRCGTAGFNQSSWGSDG
jgi:hypothetical protein